MKQKKNVFIVENFFTGENFRRVLFPLLEFVCYTKLLWSYNCSNYLYC